MAIRGRYRVPRTTKVREVIDRREVDAAIRNRPWEQHFAPGVAWFRQTWGWTLLHPGSDDKMPPTPQHALSAGMAAGLVLGGPWLLMGVEPLAGLLFAGSLVTSMVRYWMFFDRWHRLLFQAGHYPPQRHRSS